MQVFAVRDQVVVVKQKEVETKSPGGIITVSVSSSPNKSVRATVVAVGSGRVSMNGTIVPLEVKEGDTVVFNPSLAQEVQLDSVTYQVLREDAVIVLR
jgi:chaperonin GroES